MTWNLKYVLNRFFFPKIIFYSLLLFILVLFGVKSKRISYLGMSLIALNLAFFELMRSNYEFYIWDVNWTST